MTITELQRAQARSVGYLLIRAAQLWNARGMAEVNARAGAPIMKEVHARLVPHLMHPEGIRVTDLARRVGVTKQAVAVLVAEMVELGFVKMEVDPQDARARRVTVTETGLAAMMGGTEVLIGIEAELARSIGRSKMVQLRRLLGEVLEVLEEDAGVEPDARTQRRSGRR